MKYVSHVRVCGSTEGVWQNGSGCGSMVGSTYSNSKVTDNTNVIIMCCSGNQALSTPLLPSRRTTESTVRSYTTIVAVPISVMNSYTTTLHSMAPLKFHLTHVASNMTCPIGASWIMHFQESITCTCIRNLH